MTRFDWIGALIGLAVLAGIAVYLGDRVLTGQNDFVQLYAGGTLAGSGDLYDREANRRVIASVIGVTLEGVLYSRLPFYALLLHPLSVLPYKAAYAVFLGLNLGALAVFLVLQRRAIPEAPLLAAMSLPVYVSVVTGQDTLLLLGLTAIGLALLQRGRDFAGGAVLALCAIKFHIFLLPWMVTAWYRRKAAAGIAAGGAVLVILSFLAGGWTWPADYLARTSSPELHPGAEHMPTLRAVAEALQVPEAPVAVAGSVLTLGLLFVAVRRSRSFEYSFAIALVAGLVLSWHAYLQDAVILLLATVLVLRHSANKVMRATMPALLLPPVWFILLSGRPWSALVALALLGVVALAALSPSSPPVASPQTATAPPSVPG